MVYCNLQYLSRRKRHETNACVAAYGNADLDAAARLRQKGPGRRRSGGPRKSNGAGRRNEPEPYIDPYEAVRTYWSEDRLTQSWGPDQIVEHLFFHPVIAYPQWAFHDCGASQSERYGLDDWMVTADEYAKILQSVYEKGYILVAIEDV